MECRREAESKCSARKLACNPRTSRCVKPTTALGPQVSHVVRAMNEAVAKPGVSKIKKALSAIKSLAARHKGVLIVILVALAAAVWGIRSDKAHELARRVIDTTGTTIPKAYGSTRTFVAETWAQLFNNSKAAANAAANAAAKAAAKAAANAAAKAAANAAAKAAANAAAKAAANAAAKINIKGFAETLRNTVPDVGGVLSSVYGTNWKVVFIGLLGMQAMFLKQQVRNSRAHVDNLAQIEIESPPQSPPQMTERQRAASQSLARIETAYPESTRLVKRMAELQQRQERLLQDLPQSSSLPQQSLMPMPMPQQSLQDHLANIRKVRKHVRNLREGHGRVHQKFYDNVRQSPNHNFLARDDDFFDLNVPKTPIRDVFEDLNVPNHRSENDKKFDNFRHHLDRLRRQGNQIHADLEEGLRKIKR